MITPNNIEVFITRFYAKVNRDELLSPIFNQVAEVDWNEHIPKICKFWNSVLLKTGEYRGNAYQKHIDLTQMTSIDMKHFDRWLELFSKQAYIDFSESDAEFVISKAQTIARSLKMGVLTPL